MNWYYESQGQQQGPITTEELLKLADAGTIQPETRVWREGMSDWLPFAEATQDLSDSQETALCAVTGEQYSKNEMFQYGDQWVHASQKDDFLAQVKETGYATGNLTFAGFWIRVAAKIIDSIVQVIITIPIIFVTVGFGIYTGETDSSSTVGIVIYYLFSFGMPIAFTTWFLGKYAATPGKMALGLVVLEPDGSRISYKRAFARYWAEMLASLIMGIGYLMVAFDQQKRGLHDRICNTRVVFRNK